MVLSYTDSSSRITYEFQDRIPTRRVAKGRVNLAALSLYGFYRNAVYNSYREKPDLAQDIKQRKPEFVTQENGIYQEPLYHYSVIASLGAMKEWQDPRQNMHVYTAYEMIEGKKHRIGFAHFQETKVDGRDVVYIAQAGVETRGKGIGRHLMESILSHYPAGTEFYILTRVFNTDAINLYGKRLGFKSIDEKEIHELGYDERYCGYRHTTTQEEIAGIKARQIENTSTMHYLDLDQENTDSSACTYRMAAL